MVLRYLRIVQTLLHHLYMKYKIVKCKWTSVTDESDVVTASLYLQVCLQYYQHEFLELACGCPAVVCCRCSPTQKAEVVRLIQRHTGRRTAAVGDGGNDVSMIQAADAGMP